MKRFILTISAVVVALTAAAQVTREVEVTKEYMPKLPPARKLDMVADKQDTVSIRPEIDYTITPNSFTSALSTSKVRPATVTYWEFDKRYPFYIVTKEPLRRLIKYIHFWRCIIPVSLNCTTPTHPLPCPDLVSKKREYFQMLSYTAQGWPQWDKV